MRAGGCSVNCEVAPNLDPTSNAQEGGEAASRSPPNAPKAPLKTAGDTTAGNGPTRTACGFRTVCVISAHRIAAKTESCRVGNFMFDELDSFGHNRKGKNRACPKLCQLCGGYGWRQNPNRDNGPSGTIATDPAQCGCKAKGDPPTAQGVLVFHMFSALAEFEHALIRERTRAGLAAAKRAGRTGGRPPKLTEDDLDVARTLLANPDIMVADVADRLGVAPATLYRYIPAGRSSNTPDG